MCDEAFWDVIERKIKMRKDFFELVEKQTIMVWKIEREYEIEREEEMWERMRKRIEAEEVKIIRAKHEEKEHEIGIESKQEFQWKLGEREEMEEGLY